MDRGSQTVNCSSLGGAVADAGLPEGVRTQFEATFAAPFDIWRRQPDDRAGWVGRLSSAEEREAGTDQNAWFDQLAAKRPTDPVVYTLPTGETLVAAVLPHPCGAVEIVAGRIDLDSRMLAARAAQKALQLTTAQVEADAQHELIDRYAMLLADSLEEQTFLRRLTRHIEYCEAQRTLPEVAEAILPQLRSLVGMEGVCLFAPALDPELPNPGAWQFPHCSGTVPGTEEFWSEFIGRTATSGRRAVVKNYASLIHPNELAPLPELRSLVLVPIGKDGVIFGWLLGVNKVLGSGAEVTSHHALGANEIGSMEASLLEAAAVLLASQATNHRLFQEKEKLLVDTIHTLVGVIEARDSYTCGHSDRVALVARRLGTELGLSSAQCHDIFLSGLLHDIGKIGVPDDVLLSPGKLTEAEFAEIKQHPEIGARLLQGLKPLEKLIPGVLHHHEAVDGTGYPHGLCGEQIPRMARILAVADAFDAMTSDRPYRPGMPLDKAECILREGAGKQWDREVVGAYFSAREDIVAISSYWQDHLQGLLQSQHLSSDQQLTLGTDTLEGTLPERLDLAERVEVA